MFIKKTIVFAVVIVGSTVVPAFADISNFLAGDKSTRINVEGNDAIELAEDLPGEFVVEASSRFYVRSVKVYRSAAGTFQIVCREENNEAKKTEKTSCVIEQSVDGKALDVYKVILRKR